MGRRKDLGKKTEGEGAGRRLVGLASSFGLHFRFWRPFGSRLGEMGAKCRICRFCQSRQFALVEKRDRPSENVEFGQNAYCLPTNLVSAWSVAIRRVSYRVNGSLLRPWGNSCAVGSPNADATVGGQTDPPHPFL